MLQIKSSEDIDNAETHPFLPATHPVFMETESQDNSIQDKLVNSNQSQTANIPGSSGSSYPVSTPTPIIKIDSLKSTWALQIFSSNKLKIPKNVMTTYILYLCAMLSLKNTIRQFVMSRRVEIACLLPSPNQPGRPTGYSMIVISYQINVFRLASH